tara:strand:+ start:1259 stop:1846 length:588 start_codon:yes stop_codon:yes gene_type:complete
MAVKKRENTFEILNKVDVSKFTEKKGQFNYLSWAHAVRELLKACPEATWEVHLFDNADGTKQPYMKNGTGSYVQVSVNVDGVVRSQIHPVLDHRNQPIENANAFQINTSIQRCLAKAIALHGLGLYIFAGEDLPEADPLTEAQAYELNELASNIKDEDTRNTIYEAINEKQIDSGNFEACKERCNKIIEKEKTNG